MEITMKKAKNSWLTLLIARRRLNRRIKARALAEVIWNKCQGIDATEHALEAIEMESITNEVFDRQLRELLWK
jgi:hypothetical protein